MQLIPQTDLERNHPRRSPWVDRHLQEGKGRRAKNSSETYKEAARKTFEAKVLSSLDSITWDHSRTAFSKQMKSEHQKKEQRLSAGQRLLILTLLSSASKLNVCHSFTPAAHSGSSRNSPPLKVVETGAPNVAHPTISPFLPNKDTDFPVSILASSDGDSVDDEPLSSSSEDEQRSKQESSEKLDEDEEKAHRLAKASQAASLLSMRNKRIQESNVRNKATSVGARRVGSATMARSGDQAMKKLTDAIRKAATSNTPRKNNSPTKKDENDDSKTSARATESMIRSTVEGMMMSSTSVGLFGEPAEVKPDESKQLEPFPGTVLMDPGQQTTLWKAADRVTVRVANEGDDLDIANLRLSVFSDFSPDMRKAFLSRSCQVLQNRRNKGASCVVATVPRYGSILSSRPDIIFGTAECSTHEFHGTSLGRRRVKNSILYVTEVAVSPTARRKGIGSKLMQVGLLWSRSLTLILVACEF